MGALTLLSCKVQGGDCKVGTHYDQHLFLQAQAHLALQTANPVVQSLQDQ